MRSNSAVWQIPIKMHNTMRKGKAAYHGSDMIKIFDYRVVAPAWNSQFIVCLNLS